MVHSNSMESEIKEQLEAFLKTALAHMTFAEAVSQFPTDRINDFPPHVEYTPWMLLEHIRITQKDILSFLIEPVYKESKWPDEYWPKKSELADKEMWNKTLNDYTNDLQAVVSYLQNPQTELGAKVTNGDGQTIVREILLIIDHTSYHIGEFAILRQIMGTWPKAKK